jgi:hypothetical protein
MFRRASMTPATQPAVPTVAPHDTCIRCGRPTPLGVALCEQDNPGHIKGPSATQVHGTIAVGVIAGFIGFILLLTLTTRGAGQFDAGVTGTAMQADGALELVLSVTNTGTQASAASCRVMLGGMPNANDIVFFSQPIPAGQTRTFTRTLSLPAGSPTQPSAFAVRCG